MRHEFENGNRLARVRKKHEHLMKKFPNADPAFLLLKAVEFEGLNYDCKFFCHNIQSYKNKCFFS